VPILDTCNYIAKMLLPAYAKKIWRVIFDNFNKQYVFTLMRLTPNHKSSEYKELNEKLAKETELIRDVFQTNVSAKDIEEGMNVFKLWADLLICEVAKAPQATITFMQKLKELFDEAQVVAPSDQKTITKIRSDMGSKEKTALTQLLEQERKKKKLGKRDIALEFYKATNRKVNCHKFIRLLRASVIRSKEQLKKAQLENGKSAGGITIEKNERLVASPDPGRRRTGAQHERIPHPL